MDTSEEYIEQSCNTELQSIDDNTIQFDDELVEVVEVDTHDSIVTNDSELDETTLVAQDDTDDQHISVVFDKVQNDALPNKKYEVPPEKVKADISTVNQSVSEKNSNIVNDRVKISRNIWWSIAAFIIGVLVLPLNLFYILALRTVVFFNVDGGLSKDAKKQLYSAQFQSLFKHRYKVEDSNFRLVLKIIKSSVNICLVGSLYTLILSQYVEIKILLGIALIVAQTLLVCLNVAYRIYVYNQTQKVKAILSTDEKTKIENNEENLQPILNKLPNEQDVELATQIV